MLLRSMAGPSGPDIALRASLAGRAWLGSQAKLASQAPYLTWQSEALPRKERGLKAPPWEAKLPGGSFAPSSFFRGSAAPVPTPWARLRLALIRREGRRPSRPNLVKGWALRALPFTLRRDWGPLKGPPVPQRQASPISFLASEARSS